MQEKKHPIMFHLGVALLLLISTVSSSHGIEANPRRHVDVGVVRGAYYPSWVSATFPPSSIRTSLFTHIYYAFLSPSNSTFALLVDNPALLSSFVSGIRSKSPSVKTLISIGGASDGPALFAAMASTPSSRKAFIDSTIKVARDYGFDGLDLDWEFPRNPKEMQDLALLFQDWRAAISHEARVTRRPPLILTAAVYFAAEFFLSGTPRAYPIDSIRSNLDWINAMCYDYRGSWDTSATGAQAAFFDPKSNISSSYGLGTWLRAGLPGHKIVMGLPLYGRTWKLKDPNVNGVGAPAVGVGPGNGVLFYRQVETFSKDNNATKKYDPVTVSAYAFSGTSWVGYDDAGSTGVKVGLAKGMRLRGYFFWALSYDNSHWQISTQAYKAWSVRI
ncbi:hypothetical protein MLD38_006771 [Melastoma candidum]|uniref:Uncharacterized protein n=1 Tax=Melastoma candidum TaxID=119954 RepID=A0ACB9RT59_9MYRT|nr:hypothetical protein MLD38_006771 [Melastoma candidum]